MDGGMLWRNGCDGKVLRCGAGDRHQQVNIQILIAVPALEMYDMTRFETGKTLNGAYGIGTFA